MFEIFKKEIPASMCSDGVIFVSDVMKKIEDQIDYVAADTVATYETPEDAFSAFAGVRNTITFLPPKMRGYEEIVVTMYFMVKCEDFSADDYFETFYDYYSAQFSQNIYFADGKI